MPPPLTIKRVEFEVDRPATVAMPEARPESLKYEDILSVTLFSGETLVFTGDRAKKLEERIRGILL